MEDRYIAIGKVGDVLFVVFTERKDIIRLISARLATKSERKCIMDRKYVIENRQKPSAEQLREVEEAKQFPVVFDKDCEELSPAMMKAFQSFINNRKRIRRA